MLGGGYGLHKAGLLELTPETDSQVARDLSAAKRQIAALETKLGEIGSTVAGQDTSAAVSSLEGKLAELESKVTEAASAAPAGVTAAIDALKEDFEALKGDVAAVSDGGSGGSVDLTPLEDRLASLEKSVTDQPTVDLTPIDTRLAKLESEASSTTTEAGKLSGSVTGLEGDVAALKTEISGLDTRLQNTEATAKAAQTAVSTSDVSLKTLADSQARATETLSSLSADIQSVGSANSSALEALRAELDSLSKRLAQVEATMGDATAREVAARALSVSALKSAVDSGRPYSTELAAVKAGLPADIDLKALEAHADKGVEPVSVLIAQFPQVARAIHQTYTAPDRSGDVLDSFLASARSLVSVRGPGDADGTGPEATLRKMENAVSGGDLKTAIAEASALPDSAKAAAADWVQRAEARIAVDDLTDQASQEVLSALARKDS